MILTLLIKSLISVKKMCKRFSFLIVLEAFKITLFLEFWTWSWHIRNMYLLPILSLGLWNINSINCLSTVWLLHFFNNQILPGFQIYLSSIEIFLMRWRIATLFYIWLLISIRFLFSMSYNIYTLFSDFD